LFVKNLTEADREALQAGLRSSDAFTLRRSQILLASAKGQNPTQIADALGCCSQTVRNSIRAFETRRLACLQAGSSRPKTVQPLLRADQRDAFLKLLHQSPRLFGKDRSLWTLDLLGEVCVEKELLPRTVTREAMRLYMKRMGIDWKRAKHWITSPDPAYARKRGRETD
jgi:transposase